MRPIVQKPIFSAPTTQGTTASSPTRTTPVTTRTRTGPCHCSGGRVSTPDPEVSRRRDSRKSATNKTMNGRLSGRPLSQLTLTTYFCEMLAAISMAIAPKNVSGMLLKAPSAAAPNACTTM